MKNVVIIGASGHGKVIADIILKSGNKITGFLDDNKPVGEKFIGYPILGKVDSYKEYLNKEFIIAIGNSDIRKKIYNNLEEVKWHTAIHPGAIISNIEVEIKEGTVIMANAVINSGSMIGKQTIINTGSIIEHDNKIGEFTHISVGAKLAGNVSVGKASWVGIGATINNNISICDNVIVGAGSVVIRNIVEKGTYVGNPAKKIK